MRDVDGQLKSHLQAHYGDLARLLTSAKGIGPTTASTLLAQLPELGQLNRKQITSLGVWRPLTGTRARCAANGTSSADALMCAVCCMAALVGTHFNPVLKAF